MLSSQAATTEQDKWKNKEKGSGWKEWGFTTPGCAGGTEAPSQWFTTSAHQDMGCVQRSSNHPQPHRAYPHQGRIPFCLLIKSWLINQTSGSYTWLSFEGKALFPRLPPASCGPFSSSSSTTHYITFVCSELCQARSWTLITATNA